MSDFMKLKGVHRCGGGSVNKPEHRYLPSGGLWFYTTREHKACAYLADNCYNYSVFCIVTGKRVHGGEAKSLEDAKQKVFEVLK